MLLPRVPQNSWCGDLGLSERDDSELTVGQLAELRAIKRSEMSRLHNKAGEENREFTADEKHQWDALMREMSMIDRETDSRALSDVGPRRPSNVPGFVQSDGNIRALAPDESFETACRSAGWLKSRSRLRPSEDDPSAELASLSIGDFVRSLVTGPRTELEERALGEGTDSAGGYSVPDVLASRWIDLIRRQSIAIMAGVETVPLNSDQHSFATLATDPSPAWRAENAAVAESDPTFGIKTFAPKSLAVLTKMSHELISDSLNAGKILEHSMTKALALELDRVVFYGSGSGSEPEGVFNATGIQNHTYSGAVTLFENLSELVEDFHLANVEPTAIVMHPLQRKQLDTWTDAQSRPIWDESSTLKAMKHFTSTIIPTDASQELFMGDFSYVALGVRQNVTIEVLKERYRDNLQLGFIAHLRADVVC